MQVVGSDLPMTWDVLENLAFADCVSEQEFWLAARIKTFNLKWHGVHLVGGNPLHLSCSGRKPELAARKLIRLIKRTVPQIKHLRLIARGGLKVNRLREFVFTEEVTSV